MSNAIHVCCYVQVYRDDSARGDKTPTKPPMEFHLLWRYNGRSPVSMWEPIPPIGYRCVVIQSTWNKVSGVSSPAVTIVCWFVGQHNGW